MVAGRLHGHSRMAACLVAAALLAVLGSGCSSSAPAQGSPDPGILDTPGLTLAPNETRAPVSTKSTVNQSDAVPTVTTKQIKRSAPDGKWQIDVDEPVVGGVPAASAISASIDRAVTVIVNAFTMTSSGDGDPDDLSGGYHVQLATARLLSLTFEFTEDTGGVHPSEIVLSLNYDVAKGSTIDLPDLFDQGSGWLEKLSAESRALLPAAIGDGADTDQIADGTEPKLDNFDPCWFFSKDGLGITFADEQVADHATGPVTIVIPWSHLTGVIDRAGLAGGFAG